VTTHTHQTAPTQYVDAGAILAGQRPKLVRRLILAGSGPRGGEGRATGVTPEAQASLSIKYSEPDHLWMNAFFTESEASRAAARAYLDRIHARTINRDPPVSERVAPAQLEALVKWGAPRKGSFDSLKGIGQPTLVVDGTKDVVDIYTINSFILAQNLPNAQLILYPDANHGSHYQYPELFVAHVNLFSNGHA
jgi:pimeloyl-ACP methyl ester carboxylesterase